MAYKILPLNKTTRCLDRYVKTRAAEADWGQLAKIFIKSG